MNEESADFKDFLDLFMAHEDTKDGRFYCFFIFLAPLIIIF